MSCPWTPPERFDLQAPVCPRRVGKCFRKAPLYYGPKLSKLNLRSLLPRSSACSRGATEEQGISYPGAGKVVSLLLKNPEKNRNSGVRSKEQARGAKSEFDNSGICLPP
jgi:hypothetical protein